MTNLAKQLSQACSTLGLQAEFGFTLSLGEGAEIRAVARILDLGAPNGMLVVNSYDEIKNYSKRLIEAGYGYSVLSEPIRDEKVDLKSLQEMFIEWGWSGEPSRKPKWMAEDSNSPPPAAT